MWILCTEEKICDSTISLPEANSNKNPNAPVLRFHICFCFPPVHRMQPVCALGVGCSRLIKAYLSTVAFSDSHLLPVIAVV